MQLQTPTEPELEAQEGTDLSTKTCPSRRRARLRATFNRRRTELLVRTGVWRLRTRRALGVRAVRPSLVVRRPRSNSPTSVRHSSAPLLSA